MVGATKPRSYVFTKGHLFSKSGSYSTIMISECKKYGMKPVCDRGSMCKNDASALYLGQKDSAHISSRPYGHYYKPYWPRGWDEIRINWKGLCSSMILKSRRKGGARFFLQKHNNTKL